MTEARCANTDLFVSQCDHCQQRPGSINLNPPPGGRSQETGYAREVAATVEVAGNLYGLVPSSGTVDIFGSGHGLHHRRDCSEGADTPPDRVLVVDDPRDDLYRVVWEPQSEIAAGRQLRNIDGGRVTSVCTVCALRPIAR